jgi:hypothetical protein
VVHRRLEQFELIHVELLLLLACSLGSHAPARRIAVTVFIFNGQVLISAVAPPRYRLGSAARRRAVSPYQTQLRGGPA